MYLGGKAWPQELEAAGQVTFIVRNEEPWILVLCSFAPFHSVQGPTLWGDAAHIQGCYSFHNPI